MIETLQLGNLPVDVVFKDIKNVHLSVHPPTGRVRIAAPHRMNLDRVRLFAVSRLGWIKQQQMKLREQEREPAREYIDRESHYVWGKRYLLEVVEGDQSPSIELRHNTLVLHLRREAGEGKRQEILESWYREEVKNAVPELLAKWEPLLNVHVARIFVRRMRTRWGSCNPETRNIRLNTDLAKKPRECLEYIMVHELLHLLEHTHNARFLALLDHFMPRWQFYRETLNRLPVRHERWVY
jgi:predicted metal-dependent hydrolase